jgi:hypothetical protein
MRKLAMNFRAILFGADPARSDAWLAEAKPLARITSGHSPNKFKTLRSYGDDSENRRIRALRITRPACIGKS